MSDPVSCFCVKCHTKLNAPFPGECPHCGFNLDHLSGKKLSRFQKEKREKHTDLLSGREIQLYGSTYNASFDNYGDANLEDLVRFTISYGHHAKLPSKGGRPDGELIVSFIPDIIGSGVSIYDTSYAPVACSGVGILSPVSETHAHAIPVLDAWIQDRFKVEKGVCVLCGTPTAFGHPLCGKCYEANGKDWRRFL